MRGERSKNERTVIIKNLFEPELFDREVHLILDYQNDLREECNKCGTVRKVIIYDVSHFIYIYLICTWVCQFFPMAKSLKLWFADNEKYKFPTHTLK